MQNHSKSVYETLGRLGGFIGICAQFDFHQRCLVKSKFSYLKFVPIVFLVLVGLYMCFSHGPKIWPGLDKFYFLIYSTSSLTFILSLEAFIGIWTRKDLWSNFFNECIALDDEKFYKSSTIEHVNKYVKTYLIIFCALIVTPTLQSSVMWVYLGNSDQRPYSGFVAIGYTLATIYMASQQFFILIFLNDIKLRYCYLNDRVLELKLYTKNKRFVLNFIGKVRIKVFRLNKICKLMEQLYNMVFFIMLTFVFSSVLMNLLLYAYSSIGKLLMNIVPQISYIPIFWCIYACDITNKATRKLSTNLITVSKVYKEDDTIYKLLQEFSDETRLLQTDFTAARFFIINRKIAVSLLSAVATYFLVIQQTILSRGDLIL